MKYDYHLAVIGAGSAGLVVASGAAGLGAKVALIEGHKMGGDCLNYGCVPSKAFLKSAHLAHDIAHSKALGIESEQKPVDMKQVMDYVQSIIKEIEPHDAKERYEGLGVKVFEGYGSLKDRHTVLVNNDLSIRAKFIVIATGSTASVPLISGLNETPYFTNHTIFNLTESPKHLIVLGAGPIGLELGQGFCHLNSQVTVVDMIPTLFNKDDPEVGPLMQGVFEKDGMHFELEAKVHSVSGAESDITVKIDRNGSIKEVKGTHLLVSLGRVPVTKGLNLDAVGVKVNDRGYIITNNRLQSSVPNIYVCGDVVGPYQFTHMAGYQAGIVIRNTIFKMRATVNYSIVPWATYTKPEVSHVGYTEPWAKQESLFYDSIVVNLDRMDRAKTDDDRKGFLKLILGKKNHIIGATIVSNKAGEMISLASLAVQKKLKPSVFMSMIFPYPTESEIYKFAALDLAKKGFKPWMKVLIKKLLL